MKKILLFIAVASALLPGAHAATLEPEQTSLDMRTRVCGPFRYASVSFDGAVNLAENAVATICHAGEVVASTPLAVEH